MKKINHDMKIGSKLYWHDEPNILAGIVVGFTEERDVLIDFVSGRELGVKRYPIRVAIGFICKD
jgi:hypothetical protein